MNYDEDRHNEILVDNITYFKHFLNQRVIIKNPRYIIKVVSKQTGNTYYYGTYSEPSMYDIKKMLQDYMYALGEYELFYFNDKLFNVTVTKQI